MEGFHGERDIDSPITCTIPENTLTPELHETEQTVVNVMVDNLITTPGMAAGDAISALCCQDNSKPAASAVSQIVEKSKELGQIRRPPRGTGPGIGGDATNWNQEDTKATHSVSEVEEKCSELLNECTVHVGHKGTDNVLVSPEQLSKVNVRISGSQSIQEQGFAKGNSTEEHGLDNETSIEMELQGQEKTSKKKRNKKKSPVLTDSIPVAFLSIESNMPTVDFSASLDEVISSSISRVSQDLLSPGSCIHQTTADLAESTELQNPVSKQKKARSRGGRKRNKAKQTKDHADETTDGQEADLDRQIETSHLDNGANLDNGVSVSECSSELTYVENQMDDEASTSVSVAFQKGKACSNKGIKEYLRLSQEVPILSKRQRRRHRQKVKEQLRNQPLGNNTDKPNKAIICPIDPSEYFDLRQPQSGKLNCKENKIKTRERDSVESLRITVGPDNERQAFLGDIQETRSHEVEAVKPQNDRRLNYNSQFHSNPTSSKSSPVYDKEKNRYSLLKQGLLNDDNVPPRSLEQKTDNAMGQDKRNGKNEDAERGYGKRNAKNSDGADGRGRHQKNTSKKTQQSVGVDRHVGPPMSSQGTHGESLIDAHGRRVDSPIGAHGRRVESPTGAHGRRVESPIGAHGRRVDSPTGAHGRRVESPIGAHGRRVDSPTGSGYSSPIRTQGQVTLSQHEREQTGGRHKKDRHRNRQTSDQRQMPDKRQDKTSVFMKHWTMDMVSQGLKKGFLVEGTIRVNPKNYEDAYIPSQDGKSDIYISGFENRNRALNGDTVAVLVNHHTEWRVHEDSLETYEEHIIQQMRSLNVGESQCSSADVVIESEETVILENSQSDSSSAIPIPVSNCMNKSDRASDKTVLKGSSKKQKPVNNSPRNAAGSRTPLSAGRYTSVKDMLSQSGCSPVAQRLFSQQTSQEDCPGHIDQKCVQKTGKVVAITEVKHSRACSGYIKPMDRNKNFALFCPSDHRCPRIMVPISDCPADFSERPNDHINTLFIARITDWPDNSRFAHGNLARSLGEAGLIEPETEAMLIEYDIDYADFSAEALESLPKGLPWVIPDETYTSRKDFRTHCIFTIDPATARDLDDALSCEDLGNGLYEVGVHIADVSYFLQERTALDVVASQRATSVYLVQKVIPMLPRLLCEELCSLNPDKDRLTFSVIWHMTQDGEIKGEWFGRSVIRSCVKLSYNHAQGFIEDPEKEFDVSELPPISEGFSVSQIQGRVLNLHKIALNLRKKRFDNGALRLDQVKLQFSLDKETGLPNGYSVYSQRDSNRLVEEFMLLANMAVGHKIMKAFPEQALLRRHPPPQSKMFDDLHELCNSLGVPVDTSSAGALQRSLNEYAGDDEFSKARCQVLVSLCSKPMQNARYFCTGMVDDEEIYRHYALNVPIYTHFTSPIRRYPDVIVHRLLGAALGYCDPPSLSAAQVDKQADHCNDKKLASKYVQERSSDVFFAVFIQEVGPLEEAAMVMAVLDRAFDVFVLKLGVIKRVYCEKLPLESFSFRKVHKRPSLTLVWLSTETNPTPVTQEITIFTMVTAILQADDGPLKWSASVHHPGGE